MAGDALAFAGLAAALIGAGALIGAILGGLGAGGGAAITPLTYAVFSSLEYPRDGLAHGAVATALAVVAVLSLRAFAAKDRREAVDAAMLTRLAPAAVAGACLAAAAAATLPPRALLAVVGFAVALAGAQIAFQLITPGALRKEPPSGAALAAFGVGAGGVSGLTGLGGGTASTVLAGLGVDRRTASATAAGMGLAAAGAGAIVLTALGPDWAGGPPLSFGPLNLLAVLLIAPAAALTAPIGARVSHALTLRPLSIVVGLFLIASAFVMLRAAILDVGV